MEPATIISTAVAGIEQGMVTYLSAAGLSLIRAGLGTMNFGQGGFFVLGAYICIAMTSAGMPFVLAMVVGFAASALVGFFLEQLLMPLYGKKRAFSMIVTLGYSYILCDLMVLFWGTEIRTARVPSFTQGAFVIESLGVRFPKYYLFIMAVSGLIAIGFWLMLNKTKLGIYFRAIISNHKMVECLGINVKVLFAIMFMLGVGLSGIAGALNAPLTGLTPKQGLSIFSTVMPVVMIGGMTNLKGTFPAAISMGVVSAFAAVFIPTFYNVVPFFFMVICLFIRPQGLFTKKEH